MKAKKIVLVDYTEDSLESDVLDRLKNLSVSLVFVRSNEKQNLSKEIKDADVLLIRYFTEIDKELINLFPNLKYIGTNAISVSKIDVDYATSKNIVVTNAAGYCDNGIAEFVFAALLAHARELEVARANVKKNNFEVDQYLGWELKNKTFGVIGLGRIGKRVAEIALGLGMKVLHFSRTKKEDLQKEGIQFRKLNDLCKESDIIGLFIPDDKTTRSMMNVAVMKNIKKNAVIVSISHTDIFDFKNLMKNLNDDKFCFIQTYFNTIPDEHKETLMKTKNAVLYPSIAIKTKETIKKQQDVLVDNLQSFLQGKPKNKVN
ncbi:MAG: NAD(P)-dependent oxidoreductase [Patescibacteria group bacterium]